MDYILIVAYANGDSDSRPCATMMDVCNWIASVTRSQFMSDIAAKTVTFVVVDNTRKVV